MAENDGVVLTNLNSTEIKRTRSGRVSLPRLAFWAGERVYSTLNDGDSPVYIPPKQSENVDYLTPSGFQNKIIYSNHSLPAEIRKTSRNSKNSRKSAPVKNVTESSSAKKLKSNKDLKEAKPTKHYERTSSNLPIEETPSRNSSNKVNGSLPLSKNNLKSHFLQSPRNELYLAAISNAMRSKPLEKPVKKILDLQKNDQFTSVFDNKNNLFSNEEHTESELPLSDQHNGLHIRRRSNRFSSVQNDMENPEPIELSPVSSKRITPKSIQKSNSRTKMNSNVKRSSNHAETLVPITHQTPSKRKRSIENNDCSTGIKSASKHTNSENKNNHSSKVNISKSSSLKSNSLSCDSKNDSFLDLFPDAFLNIFDTKSSASISDQKLSNTKCHEPNEILCDEKISLNHNSDDESFHDVDDDSTYLSSDDNEECFAHPLDSIPEGSSKTQKTSPGKDILLELFPNDFQKVGDDEEDCNSFNDECSNGEKIFQHSSSPSYTPPVCRYPKRRKLSSHESSGSSISDSPISSKTSEQKNSASRLSQKKMIKISEEQEKESLETENSNCSPAECSPQSVEKDIVLIDLFSKTFRDRSISEGDNYLKKSIFSENSIDSSKTHLFKKPEHLSKNITKCIIAELFKKSYTLPSRRQTVSAFTHHNPESSIYPHSKSCTNLKKLSKDDTQPKSIEISVGINGNSNSIKPTVKKRPDMLNGNMNSIKPTVQKKQAMLNGNMNSIKPTVQKKSAVLKKTVPQSRNTQKEELKNKRQLRARLDELNRNHNDDIFEGKKMPNLPMMTDSVMTIDNTELSLNFTTPRPKASPSPVNRKKRIDSLSSDDDDMNDVSFNTNRKVADLYMYKREKRNQSKRSKDSTMLSKNSSESAEVNNHQFKTTYKPLTREEIDKAKERVNKMIKIHELQEPTTEVSNITGDELEDYYFNDDDD